MHKSSPTAPIRQVAAALAVAAVFVVVTATAAGAATCDGKLVIPQQGGNNSTEMLPGQVMYAGYSFQYPGKPNNYPPGAITVFKNGQTDLSVECKDKSTPTQTSITIPMPYQSYDGTVGSQGWYPSGDQSSFLTYQGSFILGSYCGPAGVMVIGKSMGAFTADVFSSDTTQPSIQARWHYGNAADAGPITGTGNGSSWSATKSVCPADITGVPIAPAFGEWAPLALVVAFVAGGAAVLLYRRRRLAVAVMPQGG